MRTALYYYRIFAGWAPNAGTLQGALNDFNGLSRELQEQFREIVKSAVARRSIDGIDALRDAAKFIN